MTSTNGHHPDEPEITEQLTMDEGPGPRRTGIEDALGLDRNGSGLGSFFNAILEMSRGSLKAEEWRVRTEYTEREIGINGIRAGRRHRAKFGWTNTELIDWNKAHDRVSLSRKGRKEIKEMFIAERNRVTPMKETSGFDRMTGGAFNGVEPQRMK